MNAQLDVVLTKTYDGKPLAVVRNLPGGDAEMTPGQMRALAHALRAAASECEAHPINVKHFRPGSRSFDLLAPPPPRCCPAWC